MFNNRTILGAIDEFDRFPMVIPLPSSSNVPEGLRKLTRYFRPPDAIRTDNGPEFQTIAWGKVLADLRIGINDFAPPYTPTKNSRIARFWRTAAGKVRAMMHGVDERVTDIAYMAAAYLYAIRARKFRGEQDLVSPNERRLKRKPNTAKLRRFGTLCFVHDFLVTNKHVPRWTAAIFLGYTPKGSSFLVGRWNKKGEFVLAESGHVKFLEQYKVSRLEHLKDPLLCDLIAQAEEDELVTDIMEAPWGTGHFLRELKAAPTDAPGPSSSLIPVLAESEISSVALDCEPKSVVAQPPPGDTGTRSTSPPRALGGNAHAEARPAITDGSPSRGQTPGGTSEDSAAERHDSEILAAPRKRGRPRGSKDTKPRKPRKSRDAARVLALHVREFRRVCAAKKKIQYVDAQARDSVPANERRSGPISRKEATKGPEAQLWAAADAAEMAGLRRKKVWREVERSRDSQILKTRPTRCHMIRVRKRCGRRKSRLVADGSTQGLDKEETFSPTPTIASMRAQLVHACQHNWDIDGADVTQAFLCATLPQARLIQLPQEVLQDGESPVKIAERALYGLQEAPRAWNLEVHDKLVSWGWIALPRERGVYYRLDSDGNLAAMLVCYVDDIIATARKPKISTDPTAKSYIDQLNAEYGTTRMAIAETKLDNGDTRHSFDFVGVDIDITYRPIASGEKHIVGLKFKGERRVRKILQKYGFENARPKATPAVDRHRVLWREAIVKAEKGEPLDIDSETEPTDRIPLPPDIESEAEPCGESAPTGLLPVRPLLGELIFLCGASRPDLSEAAGSAAPAT